MPSQLIDEFCDFYVWSDHGQVPTISREPLSKAKCLKSSIFINPDHFVDFPTQVPSFQPKPKQDSEIKQNIFQKTEYDMKTKNALLLE